MSELEILEAVASAVQLAATAYNVQKHTRKVYSDSCLRKMIESDCSFFVSEIDLMSDSLDLDIRQLILQLRQHLCSIKERIEHQKRSNAILKAWFAIGMYGTTYKEELLVALQEYQTRAVISGNRVLEQVLSRIGRDGIKKEKEELLSTILNALPVLEVSATNIKDFNKLSEAVSALEGALGEAIPIVREVRVDSEDIRIGVSDLYREVRILQAQLQESRTRDDPSGSQIERVQMILDNCTMVEYLENIKNGDAWLSDQELWQAVWDVAEAYKIFGVKIILPFHMSVRGAERMKSECSRKQRRSET